MELGLCEKLDALLDVVAAEKSRESERIAENVQTQLIDVSGEIRGLENLLAKTLPKLVKEAGTILKKLQALDFELIETRRPAAATRLQKATEVLSRLVDGDHEKQIEEQIGRLRGLRPRQELLARGQQDYGYPYRARDEKHLAACCLGIGDSVGQAFNEVSTVLDGLGADFLGEWRVVYRGADLIPEPKRKPRVRTEVNHG